MRDAKENREKKWLHEILGALTLSLNVINRIILKDFAKPKVASYHAHQNLIYKLFHLVVFEL